MPLQRDLLEPSKLSITPAAGLTEPRLWIKRLAVWKEPNGEKLRDISLRPGLNIIWSPDGADDAATGESGDAIGHGSGKTLFCRLIRYCLGEDRFATEAQRQRIGVAFPDGIVGAEIVLNGTCWAIVRPLGVRRRHMAVADGNLDEIAAGDGASTGLAPFLQSIDDSIITSALADLIRPRAEGSTWPIALAWLARDQECRFDDVLDWRSPSSDSDSPLPASGREKGPRLEALRAFLRAITPEEKAARTSAASLEAQRDSANLETGHRRWEIERSHARLASALGLDGQGAHDMPLLIDALRRAAEERVAAAVRLPEDGSAELNKARTELDAARAEWMRLDGERIRVEASIPLAERMLAQIQGELPGLSFSQAEADNPVCPICEVPIDRALAEQCKLSHKLPDADACRQRWQQRKADFEQQTQQLNILRGERTALLQQLALAKQSLDRHAARVSSIERTRDERESGWYAARRLQDEVERLAELVEAQRSATDELRDVTARLEGERGRIGAFRDKQAQVFARMNEKFDPIVRHLVGHGAKGRIVLTGAGLEISVDVGGDRRSAAIESLKVLGFDLAALCLGIEGATNVPAFLIHDSPREADMGLSIYHPIFRLARTIESDQGTPLFQYIITTTTRPPEDMKTEPWLRLTLHGTPGSERLLRSDLGGEA